MNKLDRANLQAVLKLANGLLNAGHTSSGITNIDVLEAVLDGINDALNGKAPAVLAKLDERDEAAKKCDCPRGWEFHLKGCAYLVATFDARTADGVKITDGMAVWDYNLRPGFVNLKRLAEDGWFEVCAPGEERGSMMNAERVCVRHPSSGDLAGNILKRN